MAETHLMEPFDKHLMEPFEIQGKLEVELTAARDEIAQMRQVRTTVIRAQFIFYVNLLTMG